MLRWGSSGGCLFVALFCAYGFLASGELQGTREILWMIPYGQETLTPEKHFDNPVLAAEIGRDVHRESTGEVDFRRRKSSVFDAVR